MELYLIEVRDTDEQFNTIRRGVRASLETAKSLVNELLQEYVRKDYTTTTGEIYQYEDGSMMQYWWLWSNNGNHDLEIVLSDGCMDTMEHILWIPNEDEGKMFESNEEMTEYLINNYEL
jgi:hypothetical protein